MNISITIGVTPEVQKFLSSLTMLANVASSNINAVPTTQQSEQQPIQQQEVPPVAQAAPIQQQPFTQAPPVQQPVSAVPTAQPIQQQPVQEMQPQQQFQQPPVQGVPTSAPTYDMNQLAVAATQLMDAGKRDELLGLLSSFGVQALTDLPQEQYGVFATKLRELGAKI